MRLTGRCSAVWLLLACAAPGARAGQQADPTAHAPATAATLDALYRAGYEAYTQGDLATAHARFARLVVLAPRVALAHMVYGEVLLAQGEPQAALTQLTLARQLDPGAGATEVALAQTWLALGDPAKAAACFAQAQADGAVLSPEETRDEAAALVATGRAQQARSALESALKPGTPTRTPQQTALLEDALGTLLAQGGKLGEAVEPFSLAAAADPDLASAHAHLGAAMLALHQPPEAALPELRQAAVLDPQNAGYALALGRVLTAAGQAAQAVNVLRSAVALAEREAGAPTGRVAPGASSEREAGATHPTGSPGKDRPLHADAADASQAEQARYALALALQASGQAQAALPLLAGYVARHPAETSALTNYALALVQTGDARTAVRIYAQAVADGPDDATLREDFGVAYLQQSDLNHALEQFQAGLTLQPENPHLHYDLGLAYKLKDNLLAAIPEFEKAESLDPTLPDPPYTLGVIRMQQGDFPAAAAQLEQAVTLRPDNGAAWAVLGNVYKENGDTAKATDALRKAIALDPSQPSTHISLAAILAQGGDRAGATAERRMAADLSRTAVSQQRASFALKSGRALAAEGKLKEAEAQLRTATEAAPQDAAAHAALAEVLVREGRPADAAVERQAAAALVGASPEKLTPEAP